MKPPPEKPSKKPAAKSIEKKGKTVEVEKEEPQPLDPVAEKLRQQRYKISMFLSDYLCCSFISVLILM